MATSPLMWYPFLLKRNTSNDNNRVLDDPVGFFYARYPTVNFLNLEDFVYHGGYKVTRKSYTRTLTLADGTTLANSDQNPNRLVEESEVFVTPKRKPGGKTIRIVTGKKTQKGNYQSLSFNFPSWATSLVIGDALGELIPANKISSEAGNTEIFPFAILPTGSRITLFSTSEATVSITAQIAKTQTIAQQILGDSRTAIEGAG